MFSAAEAGHWGVAAAGWAVTDDIPSPLPAIINDLAPPEAAGRYNGLGVLAFTTGFLLGPAAGPAALGRWGTGLSAALIVACLTAAAAALRLGRRLAPGVNTIEPTAADASERGSSSARSCP
jgi:hypothetical protein